MTRWTDRAGLECELRWQAERLRERAKQEPALRLPYVERRMLYLMNAGRIQEAVKEAANERRKRKHPG